MVLAPPPPHSAGATDDNFRWMEPGDEWTLFDTQVREFLHMSGEDFLRHLDAGDFAEALGDPENQGLNYLTMLSRIVR